MYDFEELAGRYISQMMEMGERFVFVEKRSPEPEMSSDPMRALMYEVERCQKCSLYRSRSNAVFGEGSMSAKIMFVGEAPGSEEDLQGRPFVGAAGQQLTKMIAAMGMTRNDVYIANVLKCRPPGNREPLPEEASACKGFLLKQIELVGPKVICGLGAHAARALLDTAEPISKLRGKVHKHGVAAFVPTYHPAALLRNPGWKRAAWDDLKLVMSLADLGSPLIQMTDGKARTIGKSDNASHSDENGNPDRK